MFLSLFSKPKTNLYIKSSREKGLADVLKRDLSLKKFSLENKDIVQGYIRDSHWLKRGVIHIKYDDIKVFEEYFKKNYFDINTNTVDMATIPNKIDVSFNGKDLKYNKKLSFRKNLIRVRRKYRGKNIILHIFKNEESHENDSFILRELKLKDYSFLRKKEIVKKTGSVVIQLRQGDTAILRDKNEIIFSFKNPPYQYMIEEDKTIWEYMFSNIKKYDLIGKKVIICSDGFDNTRIDKLFRKKDGSQIKYSEEEFQKIIKENEKKFYSDIEKFQKNNDLDNIELIIGTDIDNTIKSIEAIKNSDYTITNRPKKGILWLNESVYGTNIVDIEGYAKRND